MGYKYKPCIFYPQVGQVNLQCWASLINHTPLADSPYAPNQQLLSAEALFMFLLQAFKMVCVSGEGGGGGSC